VHIPKHLAGIVLFMFIVSISVFIVRFVAAPLQIIPPVPLTAPLSNTESVSQPVSYKVPLISLDFINRESYTTLTLTREASGPKPKRLWVSTSFFVPELPGKSWSSAPIEIRGPFAGGDRISLTVTSACEWCGDPSAPRAGYYARVNVSTVSSDAAQRAGQTETDIKTAIPVLVQVERKASR
jgi:hypothetical protein